MRAIGGLVMVAALAGPAAASPGDLPDTLHADESAAPLTMLDAASAQPCTSKGGLCVLPGARSTIAVAPAVPDKAAANAPAAAPSDDKAPEKHAAARPSKGAPTPPPAPRFSRAASLASTEGAPTPAENAAWTIELSGTLKRPAWAGNALFLFFDLEDPDALENRQFTALYQATLKASAKLAARISLSPEEGFRAGHTYRVRIVQLINGREIVLAESDLSLL